MAYTNKDKLRFKFGVEEAEDALVAETRSDGQSRVVEVKLNWGDLPLVADNSVVVDYSYVFPVGAVFDSVEFIPYVDMDSAGDALTLNVGLTDADGGSTITDVDALVVDATQTELNAGGINVAGWVGTRVAGAPLEEKALLTWEVNTAAATAGSGLLRVQFSMPHPASDTLVWVKP